MKKIFFYLLPIAVLLSACTKFPDAQEIESLAYTRVAASYDYDYIKIYKEPSVRSRSIGRLNAPMYGIYNGVLLEKGDDWCKIKFDGKEGYVETDKADFISWYSGQSTKILIAAKSQTPIYGEGYDGLVIVDYVEEGTVITDDTSNRLENYYTLMTAHDNLYVDANDVKIATKKELIQLIARKKELKENNITTRSKDDSPTYADNNSNNNNGYSDDSRNETPIFRHESDVKMYLSGVAFSDGEVTLRFKYDGLYANGRLLTGAIVVEEFNEVEAILSCNSPYNGSHMRFHLISDMLVKHLNTGEIYYIVK